MTGSFGRVTVIGAQSPVVGATPVVWTAAVVGGSVVLSCTSPRDEKRGDDTADGQCAHHHDDEPACSRRGLMTANLRLGHVNRPQVTMNAPTTLVLLVLPTAAGSGPR